MKSVVTKPSLRLALRLELYVFAVPATIGFFFGIFLIPGLSTLAAIVYIPVYGYWLYAFWSLVLHWRDRPVRDIPHRVKIGLGMGYAFLLLIGIELFRGANYNSTSSLIFAFLVFIGPAIPCTHLLVLAWRAERALGSSMPRGRPYVSLFLGACVIMLIAGIIVAIVIVQDYRRTSMERIAFTQCFEEKSQMRPCEKWRSPDYCRWFIKTYYLDKERDCYGQRWSMPRAYYGYKYAETRHGETFVIEVGRPPLIPGISDLTPGGLLPSGTPTLYKNVIVNALFTGKFEKRVREVLDSRQSTGYVNTHRMLYGMDIYEDKKRSKDKWRDAFLFPPGDAQLYVQCIVKPNLTLEENLKTQGGCRVRGNVDDRVYIEYHIDHSELPKLYKVNAEIVSLIRSFMVNEPPVQGGKTQ